MAAGDARCMGCRAARNARDDPIAPSRVRNMRMQAMEVPRCASRAKGCHDFRQSADRPGGRLACAGHPIRSRPCAHAWSSIAVLAALASPAWAIEVDGRIDPGRMAGRAARHRFPPDPAAVARAGAVSDRSLDPGDARRPGDRLPQHAAGERAAHPPGGAARRRGAGRPGQPVRRFRRRRAHRLQLHGDARPTASATRPITNENQFNTDWDGIWQHAVSEDADSWSVEMLIPWYIAPMQDGTGRQAHARHLSRSRGRRHRRTHVVAGGQLRASRASCRCFARSKCREYSQSLLAVTPYVFGVYDNVAARSDFDTGADIFWKPNGQFQLSATLNPDFGQVESDQLVVNFSAIETFFSDKRPFFTENQGFFDVPFGSLNNANRLIYTRRVGGTGRRRQRRRRCDRGGQGQRQLPAHSTTACSPRPKPTRSGAISTRRAAPATSTPRASARW